MRSTKGLKPKKALANREIVVLATWLAGGQGSYADTEDIAVKANEIAPGRFRWRKYKDQINIDTVRKRLWDASKPDQGGYLVGSERDGWLLTRAGVAFCKKNHGAIASKAEHKKRFSQREHSFFDRERIRMLAEPAYRKLVAGRSKDISAMEAEQFFRLDDYVVGKARRTKLQRSITAFAQDPMLADAVKRIATLVRER